MKKQFLKKLFAFIIAIMMFSVTPKIVNAQRCGLDFGSCPKNYICLNGFCVKWHKGNHGHKLDNYAQANDQISISDINSTPITFELNTIQNVFLKVYDETGRLVRSLASCKVSQNEYQIEWDGKDENDDAINPGVYLLQFSSGDRTGTTNLSLIR